MGSVVEGAGVVVVEELLGAGDGVVKIGLTVVGAGAGVVVGGGLVTGMTVAIGLRVEEGTGMIGLLGTGAGVGIIGLLGATVEVGGLGLLGAGVAAGLQEEGISLKINGTARSGGTTDVVDGGIVVVGGVKVTTS